MLIKIGDVLIDPFEIVAVYPASVDDDAISIMVRGGASIWVNVSVSDAEAALIASGVIDIRPPASPPTPDLTVEENETLLQLVEEGYGYLARDKDGKLYAFRRLPEYDGAYWSDPGPNCDPARRIHEGFDFIDESAAAPTAILPLLGLPF